MLKMEVTKTGNVGVNISTRTCRSDGFGRITDPRNFVMITEKHLRQSAPFL